MKDILKFLTCGSVDDGKSTLIGHMLYDAKLLFADQENALELDSKIGSRGGKLDYSLLLDGLMAEREQGITIDVAYRYFTTENRSFIVADCPGHEQYTRNMAVGASFADLAVILVDASNGVASQTRRHTRICALMGIRHVVLAVNKMDLVEYDKARFEDIAREFQSLSAPFHFASVHIIPVSATEGDNLTTASGNTRWYKGKPLLEYLETIDVAKEAAAHSFVLPVQRVCRPDHTFRGFQGQIEGGSVSTGDELTVLPNQETAKVKAIYVADKKAKHATAGQPVTIQLDREIDISRGSVLVSGGMPEVSDMFTATLLWMDNDHLVAGRNYLLKCGTMTIPATVLSIKYKLDINTGQHLSAKKLIKNEIASCDIITSKPIVFDAFDKTHALGGFILIDRITNMTSACGVIAHSLRRSENVVWQESDIDRDIRAQQKKPAAVYALVYRTFGFGEIHAGERVGKTTGCAGQTHHAAGR